MENAYCTDCGAELSGTRRFCASCGAAVPSSDDPGAQNAVIATTPLAAASSPVANGVTGLSAARMLIWVALVLFALGFFLPVWDVDPSIDGQWVSNSLSSLAGGGVLYPVYGQLGPTAYLYWLGLLPLLASASQIVRRRALAARLLVVFGCMSLALPIGALALRAMVPDELSAVYFPAAFTSCLLAAAVAFVAAFFAGKSRFESVLTSRQMVIATGLVLAVAALGLIIFRSPRP